jgi:outer membrane protein assembly factor BamB
MNSVDRLLFRISFIIRRSDCAPKMECHKGEVNSSPSVAAEVVYVGSDDGHLYAVEAETSQEQWHFETEGAWAVPPSSRWGGLFLVSHDVTTNS